jgi:cobalt-zinc-cadmium efflux system protein
VGLRSGYAVVLTTDFREADPIASMFVAALMIRSGVRLVRDSGRIFLEAAPSGVDPSTLRAELVTTDPHCTDPHGAHYRA